MNYSDCKDLTLKKDGVQVILNVLDNDEILFLQKKMWEWLTFKSRNLKIPIDKNKYDTYKSIFDFGPKHGMLLQNWDFGHNPISWYVRQNKKVIDIFASIWKTSDLITSFDGISISLPPEHTGKGWYNGNDRFHCDQCFKRNSFECVQGLVNIFDVREKDATLRFLKGSHKLHGEFQKHFNIDENTDWHLLDDKEKKDKDILIKELKEKQFYINRLGNDCDICIEAPKGSVFLWDSRTIHQLIEPQERKEENTRCVPYVCMTPRSLASTQMLIKNKNILKINVLLIIGHIK
jgi:ectoine hydroxylase-related dioxygenase (phytanoyl-CoA dioxygenase family)